MPMQIDRNYDPYQADQMTGTQQAKEKEMLAAAAERKKDEEKGPGQIPVPEDVYISSKESGERPSGLYRLGYDGEGRPKIIFEDPKKPAGQSKDQPEPDSRTGAAGQERTAEECTTDTDKVDREIKALKMKKQQLEQKIRSAAGDERKIRELERELAQVESVSSQKDNDAYRRQHAVVAD